MSTPQKTEKLEDGSKLEIWKLRRDRFDSQNNLIVDCFNNCWESGDELYHH